MDNQINTDGGSNIGGNIGTEGGDFVSRDKIINIINVERLLEFAQIEDIFPKNNSNENFESIADAVKSVLKTNTNSDLKESVAFAGSILQDALVQLVPKDFYTVIDISSTIDLLGEIIGKALAQTSYWAVFSRPQDKENRYLPLKLTEALWQKHFGLKSVFRLNQHIYDGEVQRDLSEQLKLKSKLEQELPKLKSELLSKVRDWRRKNLSHDDDDFFNSESLFTSEESYFQSWLQQTLERRNHEIEFTTVKLANYHFSSSQDFREWEHEELRFFLAGIVLDLIRLHSENLTTIRFLEDIIHLLEVDETK